MENFINYYSTSNPADKAKFKKWLRSFLETNVISVSFLKADGESRDMKCTLKADVVKPYEKKTDRKVNEEVCFVFDVDKNEWRSFRYDRVTAINLTLE